MSFYLPLLTLGYAVGAPLAVERILHNRLLPIVENACFKCMLRERAAFVFKDSVVSNYTDPESTV